MTTQTLRPGLLISLKTEVKGNVKYKRRDIGRDYRTVDGEIIATWETERTISDPAEHDAAIKVRSKTRSLITGVCAASAFGLLCPEAKAADLQDAIAEARRLADAFNATANVTSVSVYVITGRIAPDDVEAVRAISSEVRDLLAEMSAGIENVDVKRIRAAATKAKGVGTMLSPEMQERIQVAVDAARAAAKKIVKAGETAAIEVDRLTMATLAEARTAFLDLEQDDVEVQQPEAEARAIDLMPEAEMVTPPPAAPVRQIEMD